MLFIKGLWHWVRASARGLSITTALVMLSSASAFAASTVTLAWDASTSTNVAGYKIHYGTSSGNYTGTLTVGGATSATLSNLLTGTIYYIAATAYDSFNIESDYSNEVSYTNNAAVPPTIVLASPANNAGFAAPATVGLAANVTANGHAITKVQFYNGATLLGEDSSAPYAYSWTSVPVGQYSLSAKAVYDSGSTVTSSAASIMVTNVTPPTIALTSPANGSAFTAPVSIALAASVNANGHFITKVQFFNGSTLLGEDTTAPYGITWASVPVGTYSVTARLVYDTGATLSTTPAASVTVAAPKPGNTPPTITGIADQIAYENTPTAAIPFSIADAETTAAGLLLSATSDNQSLLPTNNIIFGGSDGNRTVVLVPATGETGTVQVAIYVTDGTYITNSTFTLTVQSGSTPIRVVDSLVSSNDASGTLASSTSYNGLFYEGDAVRLESAGSFTVTVTSKGKYSARFQFGKVKCSASGFFDTDGNATNSVNRKGGAALKFDLHITGSRSEQISGHVTDGDWTAALAGDRAEFGKSAAAPFAGTYTLVMPGYETNSTLPAGDSFGSLKVDSAGKVKFVGTLADGTKVSQSAAVAKNGLWPLYASLYSGGGSLMSWITFASTTNSDLSGQVIWLKQGGAKSKYYTSGFTANCQAFGSTYRATDPILALPSGVLSFYGGDLGAEITNSITIGAKNKVGTPGKELKLAFSKSNGTFKGTYANSAGGKPVQFGGAVFQKGNAGFGTLFGTGDQTSAVRLSE